MTVVVRRSDCDVVGQVREFGPCLLVNQVCRREVGSFTECEVLRVELVPNGTKIGEGQLGDHRLH